MKIRYLVAWLVLLAVAMLNGALREFTFGKYVSELAAHQLSCLIGILLFAVVIRQYVRLWPPVSAQQAWHIGLFWMVLTVVFEFLFFHYVAGHPWQVLLANYDMSAGRLWPLILIWVAVAPYVFSRFSRQGGR
ncbi:MAG: hypothetical protein KJ795_10665 [Gammaproteobacteria bacterium]|nr:hypothetical protein [Gammaproteobacteria bacterium]MBU1775350.1 hypothetical protein [Gammaproteobacteria bacterium]MBU1969236.1 hypothetical protein [Gammaproteobacteria bacterium]